MAMAFLSSWMLRLLSSIPTSLSTQQTMTTTDTIPDSTVILGSGVIGLSTAYYLALSLHETIPPALRPPVVVVEPAPMIAPGASSGATGGLGDFGFTELTAPLGNLSYALHKELASSFGGRRAWGFQDQSVFRVTPKDFTGMPSPPDSWGPAPPIDTDISSLPSWIQPADDWAVQLLAKAPHGAHLDPARFCQFLHDRCKALGVQFHFNSAVTAVQPARDTERFTSVTIETRTPTRVVIDVLPCNALVIAAGPWSPRVFSDLFPDARVYLRMNTTAASGNHVRVRNPHWTPANDDGPSSQVFLNNVLPGAKTMDITSFAGGSLYLSGWGATPEPLPDSAEDVQPQQAQINAMLEMARRYLRLEPGEDLEASEAGRCYRPLAVPNRPIITRVQWSLLGDPVPDGRSAPPAGHQSPVMGGLYINTGHNSDGVTLGPGSGMVMSELLLGRTPSVPMSGFGMEHEPEGITGYLITHI